jgi:aquaporin Z
MRLSAEVGMNREKVDDIGKVPPVKLDRPLHGMPHPFDKLHPQMYAAELAGTALLVFIGLSIVIVMWGQGAPLASLPIPPDARRLLTGFLFGTVGASIAYSPIGRMSGAHINPAMTFAFWLEGKLRWRDASFYVLAQLIGAAFGSIALLVWGAAGASDTWGASMPEHGVPFLLPIAGEALCTFLLVFLIFVFAAHKITQPFTPLVNPPLFAILTWLEAPLSGASANPARSFGPEVVSRLWEGWWIYWIGPCLGAGLAVLVLRNDILKHLRPAEARLCHFGHHGATGERLWGV